MRASIEMAFELFEAHKIARERESALAKSLSLLNEMGKAEIITAKGNRRWVHSIGRAQFKNGRITYRVGVTQDITWQLLQQAVNRTMETGDPFDTEVEIITAKGNRRRIHVIGKAVFTDGKITHRLGVTQDITERKRTEDILRNNEEKFRRLFEAVSDSLFLIDNETGQIYETNSSAVKMYGYSREELLTKRNVDMSAEPDSTREATLSRKSFVPVRWHKKRTERYSL